MENTAFDTVYARALQEAHEDGAIYGYRNAGERDVRFQELLQILVKDAVNEANENDATQQIHG